MIFRAALLGVAATLVLPGVAAAAVKAGQLLPTNLLTVPDSKQVTGLRVNLPKPDCGARPSDCADVDVLNELDGFNIQPRMSIPLSGAIDLSTVSKGTVFLVSPDEHVVGPNQLVWEPAANTLYVESDEQLDQSTTYLLVVTRGVHGADGEPLDATSFRHDLNYGQTKDPALKAYRKALLNALPLAMAGGASPSDIAAASLFTTQSITPISQKIRGQLQRGEANFGLGTGGVRTVFPFFSVASVTWQRQVKSAPPDQFTTGGLFLPLLAGVGTIAFGSYSSPDYETAAKIIPAVGTLTGTPVPRGTNTIQFSLFLPAGARPAGGWPVAIFGHGFTDWKNGAPPVVAGRLAQNGIASIAINVVGHGGGPLGTYTVGRTGGLPPVTLPLGGRGIDQDGNGSIDSTEGVNAAPPFTLIGNRDGLRQTTIDLMQLVKVLEGGVDVDGDGTDDLSTSRLYYAGQSFGGIYGTQLMGLEPDLRAGVLNVAGGPIIEIARLSPSFRGLVGLSLLSRTLYNAVPNPGLTNFHENIPLRNLPPVTATPDETAIQQWIDRDEWAQQAGNPAAYAPHITAPVIFQFARGDQTVPNPTTSAILRACGCAERATLYRNDLAFALNPAVGKNPHAFITNVGNPAAAPFALAAQQQIATFFTSDGAVTIDPDGAGPIFETPTSMVPEDLAFIP